MTVAELTSRVQYVTDFEGNRRAVMLDIEAWHELLSELRWEELFTDPRTPELLEQMAAEARADIKAGRTRELDPDLL